jgi:hypothetical protein
MNILQLRVILFVCTNEISVISVLRTRCYVDTIETQKFALISRNGSKSLCSEMFPTSVTHFICSCVDQATAGYIHEVICSRLFELMDLEFLTALHMAAFFTNK